MSFKAATGELQVDASYSKEKAALRRAFAQGFLGDKEVFETAEAMKVFDLGILAEEHFALPVFDPAHSARLSEIRFSLPTDTLPSFCICSANVLETLQNMELREKIRGASVASAKIKLSLGAGRRDKKTIQLVGSNSISYNASTHKETVEHYLREWGIFLAQESAQIAA